MNNKIDTKSIIIGLLAGIAVTLAVGAALPTGQIGRYQIAGAGNHAVIIDTVTGQVWQSYMPPMEGSTDADFFKAKIEGKK